MKIKLGLCIIAFMPLKLWAAISNSTEVFATQLSWTAETSELAKKIEEMVAQVKTETPAYDPDCYYSKQTPCEPGAKSLTKELDQSAALYKTETKNAFDVVVEVDKKAYRDYGGFAQGYVVNQMRQKLKGKYVINFSGDIFVSGDFSEAPELSIGVPGVDNISFAKVIMKSGWMLGSSSPQMGSKIRVPKDSGNPGNKFDFKKIVLFAKADFDGARLDAWSTALIVGGKKLLNQLRAEKAYAGQWAYLYFDDKGKPKCSSELVCKLGSELKNNYVKVNFK